MIARKSEFAQKLLDDLRLRKERIASGTVQSHGHPSYSSMVVSQDSHGHQRNTSAAMANKTPQGTHRRSSSCGGSFGFEQSSNQLKQSAAVMDSSMLSFLHQITHGSVTDFRSSQRKGNLKISSFHFKEVSEGAQKLTNIIEACSGERNTGKYSIEIGKELFRSAKDLVESLTMLTELQEAADIITTHRKSRVKLLESNDENPVTLEKQKHIDKPRCTSFRQRSVAMTYITDQRSPNSDSSARQRRSDSHIDEKRGVPNIVAKLMGLVDVSQHSDSENEMRRESQTKLVAKMKPISHNADDDSRKTNKHGGDQFSQTRIGKNIPEKQMQSSDSLSSQRCNRVVNKLQNDMKIAEEKNRTLKIQEKEFSRTTQQQMIQKESQETRRKSANDQKEKNSTRQVPISDQKRRIVILPRKEKHETKTDIRNLSKTGIGLSKRKVLGQSDRKRQVDRIERQSGRNGLHKIHKTEHQYHETKKQHNRRSVTASSTEVPSVLTRNVMNSNDDQTTVEENHQNLISKNQKVLPRSKTSNALTLKEDLPDRSQSETLNEEETELKRKLIQNPNFRNRAKTLFNIQIAENQDCDYTDNDDKHMFETTYEIMERKSTRQDHHELKFNTLKSRPLNELVKRLCKDLEILRCYGGVWNDDDIGGNLLKMVERDVYGREMDVNCMWDYGWNSDWIFALSEKDGVIEEVEKCIVDDLLDDFLDDFLHDM